MTDKSSKFNWLAWAALAVAVVLGGVAVALVAVFTGPISLTAAAGLCAAAAITSVLSLVAYRMGSSSLLWPGLAGLTTAGFCLILVAVTRWVF